ncbi:hypothetical protein C7M84_011831 [Penaeus vannamei]|uniref:Uncharacterized protein n=1 Tax=Penaeus vannamei TaxID=6689 RepID=A0A423UBG3_PENVA|nr:hypothetical protein C7M84_011831 [Penaeus vannamei]
MRQILALFPVLAFLLQPVVGPLPTKEELCSTVVDIEVRKLCLDCFTDAGSLQESPDEFRFCVGSYLPQAMQHAQPNVHHNHTNANLMPRCLTKSLERLQRYLERENIIARSGGRIVKAVATSNLVKDGGPVLMGVSMVDSVASECLTKYHNHGHGSGGGTRSRRMKATAKWARQRKWRQRQRRPRRQRRQRNGQRNGASVATTLPFDGKGPLAESILKGQCIVNKLIENHFGYELISLMSREEFFLPIPSWWLEPLAVYYKEFREKFENGTSV